MNREGMNPVKFSDRIAVEDTDALIHVNRNLAKFFGVPSFIRLHSYRA